jgi:hypothetical protein
MCFDLMWEHWNPACQPPWDDWELETIIRNAANYGEDTEGGVKGFLANEDAFRKFRRAGIRAAAAGRSGPGQDQISARLCGRRARSRMADPEHAARNGHGYDLRRKRQRSNPSSRSTWRSAWHLEFPANGTRRRSRMTCYSWRAKGRWRRAKNAGPRGWNGSKSSFETITDFSSKTAFPFSPIAPHGSTSKRIWELKAKPALIVIDTMTRLLNRARREFRQRREHDHEFHGAACPLFECFVLAIHHTGKDQNKGARGSSAFYANIDAVISMKLRQGGTELRVRKQKDADVSDEISYFQVKESGVVDRARTNIIACRKSSRRPANPATIGRARKRW